MSFSVDVLPVRLIDLAGTLAKRGAICFTEPTAWDFHVISHTWSQDVRVWSSEIGKLQRRSRSRQRRTALVCCGPAKSMSNSSSSSSLYNELFQSCDLTKHKAYELFVEFLQVLRADGVERVWFDALCINQEDMEEKSREIKNMGTYYSRSLGCYVWAHGVGQRFSLWDRKEIEEVLGLPRWFSRVWTFQELLLPKNLVFLVELDFDERQMLVNPGTCLKMYSLMGHQMTYCCPQIVSHSIIEKLNASLQANVANSTCMNHNGRSNVELPAEVAVDELGSLVKAVFICDRCGASVANSRQVGRHALMCLVERSAYMDIMYRTAQLAGNNVALQDVHTLERLILLVRKAHGDLDDVSILRMHGMVANASTSAPPLSFAAQVVLGEIGERQCSEGHDEDRVLSVLALLRVEEVAPVRVGKTLHDQILELAKALLRTGNQQLLLQLCSTPLLSDNYNTPGMSWVPPFKVPSFLLTQDRDSFLEIGADLNFQPIAQVQSASSLGITFSCHIIYAKVSLHSLSPLLYSFQLLGPNSLCDSNTTYLFDSISYSPDQLCLTPSKEYDLIGSLVLQAKNIRSICQSSQFSLNVSLLLLASIGNEGDVFMACVGRSCNKLHKIGILVIPRCPEGNMFQNDMITCIVGGFGKYIPKHFLRSHSHSRIPQLKHVFKLKERETTRSL